MTSYTIVFDCIGIKGLPFYEGKPFLEVKILFDMRWDGLMLFSEDAIKIENRLFLFAKNLNILFSINIDNGSIKFYGSIPEEETFCKRLSCKLIHWKNKIIVVPLKAKKIWIYSLNNNTWKGISFDRYKLGASKTNFRQAIVYKESLFLFGGHYPAILKMELSTYKISYIKEPFYRYTKTREKQEELYFRGDFVCEKNIILLASCKNNSILKFDLETQAYKWIEIGGKSNKYSGIMWDGNNYWIAPRHDTPIVKWNGREEFVEYKIPRTKTNRQNYYSGIVKRNNQIIIPALGNNSHTVILTNEGVMKFDNRGYMFYKKTEKGEYIAQYSDGRVIYVNAVEEREFDFSLSEDYFDALLDSIHIYQRDITEMCSVENVQFTLVELLRLLQKMEPGSMQNIQNDENKIWVKIKIP